MMVTPPDSSTSGIVIEEEGSNALVLRTMATHNPEKRMDTTYPMMAINLLRDMVVPGLKIYI
jgi:hypothetical protein